MSANKNNGHNAPSGNGQIDNAAYASDPEARINAWLRIISNQSHGKVPDIPHFEWHINETIENAQQDWMNDLVPQLRIHSLDANMPHPAASFLLTIKREHCNNMGTLHGGCTATLFDICTTLPLAFVTRPGFWDMLGVSRTLSISYLSAARVGDEVVIECELLQVGNKLAAIKGVMRRKKDNTIVATCEHGKYNAGAKV